LPTALLALAISAFGIGTTEFIMMGLLPEIAAAFRVSIPTAGDLISGYALGVVVGAPLFTAASTRLSRRTVLLGLMAVFTVGNLFAAVAQSYTMLLAARVLTGLPHGALFGVGSVVAAGMVPEDKRATAISMMFAGLALANVIGVPAGTLVSQHVGWRVAFALIAAIGVVSIVAIWLMLPREPQSTGGALGPELATFRRPQVWLALAVGTFGFAGVFAVYSYIEPMMTHVAGYSSTSVNWLLALFGIGMTVGNLVGGRLADRALMPSMYGALGALGLVLALFVVTAHNPFATATRLGDPRPTCRTLVQQAYMLGTNDIFWLWGWVLLALIALTWLTRPPFLRAYGSSQRMMPRGHLLPRKAECVADVIFGAGDATLA
jgi:MFS transporter, DHA1 family, inner membrane transport protein